MELEVFLLGPPLGFEPPPLPFVEAADFLLLVSCNFLFEAADDVFRLFEERLDSIVGTGGGALVSPLLPLEQAMEGGEEGVAFGVDEPVELMLS